MTERVLADPMIQITVLPIALAAGGYRPRPDAPFEISGRLGGFRVDTVGVPGVFAAFGLPVRFVRERSRPAMHPERRVFILAGEVALPQGVDRAAVRDDLYEW